MKRVFMRFDALTPQAIGEAVRLRRKALGNTLDDLAEASGISKRTLIKLEQGQDVRFSTLTTVLSCAVPSMGGKWVAAIGCCGA